MAERFERARIDIEAYAAKSQAEPCFICKVIDGTHHHEHPVVYRDDAAIAFLNRFPTLLGYVLVAPIEHRENVVGDFELDEYLRLQSVVYRVSKGIEAVLPTERMYVLSLGSKQGNAHLHWHLAPLPPGVPYEKQQYYALMTEPEGYLDVPIDEQQALADRIAAAISG